jgi:choline-phosphate cytidylyltransferase
MLMIKVITYGTYDHLHYGHIRLLERAKQLGDYLIVGVTADDFDKSRGKINVQQSLAERIEAVKSLEIADEIIVEEYEGQKIDDILRFEIDIFTVGSDWIGKFDYLNEFCRVVYLERTEGVSSSEIRDLERHIKIGMIGNSRFLNKFEVESHFVNGIHFNAISTTNIDNLSDQIKKFDYITADDNCIYEKCDAVYIHSNPSKHYEQIKNALRANKNVLCESPISLRECEAKELFNLASESGLILQECIKTAYTMAYARMLLLLKSGKIGKIVSVDATCTSLSTEMNAEGWSSRYSWGPTAILPVLQILGNDFKRINIYTLIGDDDNDLFTKFDFQYDNAVATVKVGKGVKSEGELIVSGTNGYVYVPAPWWKTDYFEVRYENPSMNRRYFYQLDGEGIRHELVAFAQAVQHKRLLHYISTDVSITIAKIMEQYNSKINFIKLEP